MKRGRRAIENLEELETDQKKWVARFMPLLMSILRPGHRRLEFVGRNFSTQPDSRDTGI